MGKIESIYNYYNSSHAFIILNYILVQLGIDEQLKNNFYMKKIVLFIGCSLFVLLITTGCTALHQTMREPTSSVKFTKNDFVLSEQVSAQARTIRIIGIDWARLFSKKTGSIDDKSSIISAADIPVIGNFVSDRTKNYALFNLMSQNKGYDVVFYPQYMTKVRRPALGIGWIVTITTVEATARLGKLKGDVTNSPAAGGNNPVVQSGERSKPVIQPEGNKVATNDHDQLSTPVAGEKAYNDYIEKNRRPLSKYDDCSSLHGKVILSFKVNKQGRPEDITVFRSLCRAADREAIRLLQNGPDWTVNNKVNRLEINF